MTWLAALAGFLLPLQTVWILRVGVLGGIPWSLSTIGVHASDVVFAGAALVGVYGMWTHARRASPSPSRALGTRISPIRCPAGHRIGDVFRDRWRGVIIGVLPSIGVMVTNIAWSANAVASAVGWARLVAFLLALHGIPRAPEWRRAFVAGFTIAMVGHAILGITQFAAQEVPASTFLGIASHAPWVHGDAVVETADGRWLRAYGGFPHPNVFGTALLVAIIAVISLMRGRSVSIAARLPLIAAGALLTFALVLTFSRAAWLGLIVLLIILARHPATRRLAVVGATTFAITIALAAPLVLPRVTASGRIETRALAERQVARADATHLLRDPRAFMLGVGIHGMPAAIIRTHPERDPYTAQPIHNVPLLALVEVGVVGILVILVVIVGFHRTWREPGQRLLHVRAFRFAPWLALLPSFLFDHHLWSLPVGLALLLALAVANGDPAERTAHESGSSLA